MNCEQIATIAHSGQCRRDAITGYIEHPRQAVSRVWGTGREASLLIDIAWLHDVLEDTEETAASLPTKGVRPEVIRAVEILTHSRIETYTHYLSRIKKDPLAVKVKIADMLANLADEPTEYQIKKYAKGIALLAG